MNTNTGRILRWSCWPRPPNELSNQRSKPIAIISPRLSNHRSSHYSLFSGRSHCPLVLITLVIIVLYCTQPTPAALMSREVARRELSRMSDGFHWLTFRRPTQANTTTAMVHLSAGSGNLSETNIDSEDSSTGDGKLNQTTEADEVMPLLTASTRLAHNARHGPEEKSNEWNDDYYGHDEPTTTGGSSGGGGGGGGTSLQFTDVHQTLANTNGSEFLPPAVLATLKQLSSKTKRHIEDDLGLLINLINHNNKQDALDPLLEGKGQRSDYGGLDFEPNLRRFLTQRTLARSVKRSEQPYQQPVRKSSGRKWWWPEWFTRTLRSPYASSSNTNRYNSHQRDGYYARGGYRTTAGHRYYGSRNSRPTMEQVLSGGSGRWTKPTVPPTTPISRTVNRWNRTVDRIGKHQQPSSSTGVYGKSRTYRQLNGKKLYDVPQIECPTSENGIDRFACPSPDIYGRYLCIDDQHICNGFVDCPKGEDEDSMSCMFYKSTKAHLDVLADYLLQWARGRHSM